MDAAFDEEILSINSIYGEDTLKIISHHGTGNNGAIGVLDHPVFQSVVLRVAFPRQYPDGPLEILGTETIGDDAPKGIGNVIVELAREVLEDVYEPGFVCIYDLIEALEEKIASIPAEVPDGVPHTKEQGEDEGQVSEEAGSIEKHMKSVDINEHDAPEWTTSDPFTEKKSVFVARAVHVTSVDQAKHHIQHLLSTDKKITKASHNMTAWRIRGPNETTFQDCDDDGETAAGGRILHLMQLMDVWDVVVVVSRWYGGVHLGPDRFRLINQAARDALVKGGFDKASNNDNGDKKRGRK